MDHREETVADREVKTSFPRPDQKTIEGAKRNKCRGLVLVVLVTYISHQVARMTDNPFNVS